MGFLGFLVLIVFVLILVKAGEQRAAEEYSLWEQQVEEEDRERAIHQRAARLNMTEAEKQNEEAIEALAKL